MRNKFCFRSKISLLGVTKQGMPSAKARGVQKDPFEVKILGETVQDEHRDQSRYTRALNSRERSSGVTVKLHKVSALSM
jgi:hypothetical protein